MMESVSVVLVMVAPVVTNVYQATLAIQIAFPVIVPRMAVFQLYVTILDVVNVCRISVVDNVLHVKPVISNILNVSLVAVILTVQLVSLATMRASVSVPITLTANNVMCAKKDSITIQHVKSAIVILLE